MEKRSLTIAGHRTSLALEPEFWAGVEAMAAGAGKPVTAMIGEIDEARSGPNLSSAVRIAVLRWYQSGAFPGKVDPALRFGNATNEKS